MPAPRRATSAKQLKPMGSAEAPLTGWAQMDGWGKPFDPFADNPLQRAFAADYRCNLQPPLYMMDLIKRDTIAFSGIQSGKFISRSV